jgi:hypothetical protein
MNAAAQKRKSTRRKNSIRLDRLRISQDLRAIHAPPASLPNAAIPVTDLLNYMQELFPGRIAD